MADSVGGRSEGVTVSRSVAMLDALMFSYTVPCIEEQIGRGTCSVHNGDSPNIERRTFKVNQLDADSADMREIDACWVCRKLAQDQVMSGRYKPRPILKSKVPNPGGASA